MVETSFILGHQVKYGQALYYKADRHIPSELPSGHEAFPPKAAINLILRQLLISDKKQYLPLFFRAERAPATDLAAKQFTDLMRMMT